jgi:diguanylate cyclase (GGDEF)-like protein
LIEKINSVVADGLSDTEEVSAVTAAFTTYRAKLALLSIAFEIAVSTIYGVMIEGLRGEINTEIGGIRDSITEINTAISDLPLGQISETALYGIRAQRNIIYNDYTELKTRYDIISADLYSIIPSVESTDYTLINTQYTDLTGIYSQYEASFNTLYSLLETSFQDSYMTVEEKKDLDEFIDKKMPHELEKGTTYAVMFLDIDYFKMVNDTYGHDAGDAILQKLSRTMKESISEKEFIIRFGGEEFLIIMKNPTPESANELATKINNEFGKLIFTFNNVTFNKTVSIGYAFFPTDTDQIWKCIKFADLCLYEAKETGRNKVIRFTPDLLKDGDKENY